MYLSADPEQVCWAGKHLFMVLCVFLPQLIIYILGMPITALLLLFSNRHHLESSKTKYRWGILYVGLRHRRYYWEFVIAMRKAALFSLSVLGSTGDSLAIQTHLAMLVIFFSLLTHLVGRPYESEWVLLDIFEVSGLVVCWILMWCGIVFYQDGITGSQKEFTTVCLVVLNAVYALVVGIVLIRQKAEEGATWTVILRTRLCCLLSEQTLRRFGSTIPSINPASRYVKEMFLLEKRRSFFALARQDSHSVDGVPQGENRSSWTLNPQAQDRDTSQSDLPEGWFVTRDENTGMLYYYTMEGKTSWNPPEPRARAETSIKRSVSRTIRSVSKSLFAR